ncbi:hypothetical protein MJO29_016870, partial [Puccinia striiformis f. sp. tritici]
PGSSGLILNQVLSFRSSRVHALTVDSDVHIERSLDIDQPTSSLFKSPMFPPLNLTMDLSDPLSGDSRGKLGNSSSGRSYCPARITSVGAECDHTIHHSTRTNSEKSVDIDETKTSPEGLDMLADSLADKHEKRLINHETGQPPKFDLILISIGEEGQFGSLYPPHPILGESIWIVAWSGDVWEPPSNRIALTPPVLNSARQFAFLAVGSEIVEIVPDGLDRSIQSNVHGRRS